MEILRIRYNNGALEIKGAPKGQNNDFKDKIAETLIAAKTYDLGDGMFEFYISNVDIEAVLGESCRCTWNQNVFVDSSDVQQKLSEQLVANELVDEIKSIRLSKKVLNGFDPFYRTDGYAGTFLPIVHVAPKNILNDETSSISRVDWRSRSITDSSIWNYFLSLETPERFRIILEEIFRNYQKQYYSLDVTHEFANLSARQIKEDYLEGGGHKDGVVPFVFHSETQMRENILRLIDSKAPSQLRDCKNSLFNNLKWRFLLVDDKIGELDNQKSFMTPSKSIAKPEIIKDRLEMLGFKVEVRKYTGETVDSFPVVSDDVDILLVCVKDVETAQQLMFRMEFDIVLLDYLLDGAYGHELLSWLEKDVKINSEDDSKYSIGARSVADKVKVGPNGRFFFMFISAFSVAVSERLRHSGLLRSRSRWHIGEGACPTNTPYLFLYQLIMLMRKRLIDSGIADISKDTEVKEILSRIYDRKSKVKREADKRFKEILVLLYKYKSILMDVSVSDDAGNAFESEGSVLCTTFIMSEGKQRVGSLLEHAVHLVYLTAFGTVRQWPEIWEESRYVATQIDDDKVIRAIENFVYTLKSES